VLWSPDSRSVTFLSRNRTDTVYARGIGTAIDVPLYFNHALTRAEDYSADGKTLLLREPDGGRILAKDLGSTTPPRVLATLGRVDEMRLSPDGHFVSWNAASGLSEDWQVWVASYPSFENRRQVSPAGGRQARWRADSKELFYLTRDGTLMSAALIPGPVPEFRAPTRLFKTPIERPSAVSDEFDLSQDGQRFLLLVHPRWNSTQFEQPPLRVVVNWISALHRKQ